MQGKFVVKAAKAATKTGEWGMSIYRKSGFSFLKFIYTLLALAVLAGASGCHRKPSEPKLAPELAAIPCPADRPEHAWATIGNAKVMFLCIPQSQMAAPNKIGCIPGGVIRSCDVVNEIQLSHRAGDTHVHAGSIYDPAFIAGRSASEKEGDSQLYVIFHEGPPTTPTFDATESPGAWLLPDGATLLPSDFTFVKGTLCQKQATVLNTGVCFMEAQSASAYWHITVTIWHAKGTEISADEYRTELAFWMSYLDKMVSDPKTPVK